MNTKDFYYDLPPELIAQTPATPRDSSRMIVMDKSTGELQHKHFYDLVDFIKPGDLIVINDTKVIPARIYGKTEKGKDCEFLLLKRLDYTRWECICRPAKKIKIGSTVAFSEDLSCKVESISDDNGVRIVNFSFDGVFEDILDKVGNMPLPPYITQKLEDKTRYNTVYSKYDGSAAAPTAGLHFTDELMQKIKDKGAEFCEVLLHVGLGTFRPVKCENIEDHKMHSEYYEISERAAQKINLAKKEGRRVIAVGTTSVRTLESAATEKGVVKAGKANTSIFIYPPYDFKIVDALITNFHLPESTLIMLVSAFAGKDNTFNMYHTAVKEKYRFFSFGDACFIQ